MYLIFYSHNNDELVMLPLKKADQDKKYNSFLNNDL